MKRKSKICITMGIFVMSALLLSCSDQNKKGEEKAVQSNVTQNEKAVKSNVTENEKAVKNNTKENKKAVQSNTKEDEKVVKSNAIKEVSLKEKKLDLKKYSLKYREGEDHQPFFINNEITKSKNGYYFWKSECLMFFDKASEKVVPLCNLPNCKHKIEPDSKCNAYFESGKYTFDYVQYYNGNVYVIGLNEDSYVCIFKVAKDGSTREESCKLYKFKPETNKYGSEGYYVSVCIQRGYAYFIDNEEKDLKLRKIKLDSKQKPEVLYEATGIRPVLYRMEANGDYLFFQSGNYTDETCERVKGGIYACNLISNEVVLVKKDAVSSYVVRGSDIFYSKKNLVNRYNLITQEDEIFVNSKGGYAKISADKNYIYVVQENENKVEKSCYIYNEDKSVVCQISSEGRERSYHFGDDKYLFVSFMDSEGTMKVLDKEYLKKGKCKWKVIY